jgi:hypothetical protein
LRSGQAAGTEGYGGLPRRNQIEPRRSAINASIAQASVFSGPVMKESKSRSSSEFRFRANAPKAWLGKLMRVLDSDRHLIGLMIAVSLLTGVGIVCSISS